METVVWSLYYADALSVLIFVNRTSKAIRKYNLTEVFIKVNIVEFN